MITPRQTTTEADPIRRAALASVVAAALLPAVGCGTTSSRRRRYASDAPSPRWPDLPPSSTPTRPPVGSTRAPVAAMPTNVRRRSDWAQNAPIPRRMDRMLPVRRLTVHHDGMPPVDLRTSKDVAARIDLIRRAHQGRGWGDIGYHYIVDPMGNVWEGRPLRWQGAHVAGNNQGNLGVMVLGNFQQQRPTNAQLDALDRFIAAQLSARRLRVSNVYTHQEFAPTECPGRSLQAHMTSTRRPTGRMAMLSTARSLG